MFLKIGCSNVATGGGGGGQRGAGGEGGRGWATVGWGATARCGVNSGVTSTSLNFPSQHKYKSPKQFELKQRRKALRALNAHWALPVYPIFEDEKSKASDEKSVKRKIA